MLKLGSLAFAIGLAFAPSAMAAEGSIGLTPGSGTNAALTAADGAGFVSFLHALCGGASATMGTACANQAEVNSSGQLVIDVAAGTVTANAGTNLNTSLLATDAHLTALGTTSLATDAHLTSFTSANHTDLTTINTTLGTLLPEGTAGLATIGGSAPSGTAPVVIIGNTNPNGQTTMANSSPVVLASDQSAISIKLASPYPATAVPITASATGTTAATTATLTNVSGHTTYLCGFSIRANATAAATGNATVTGTITATMNFTQWTAPLASGLGVTEETFSPCVPASAVSTSIAVVSAAPGSGGVVSVSAWGYSI